MLDYYRTHSQWTNPGQQETMLHGIPDDIPSVVKAVQGCLIHGGLLWLYDLKPSQLQDKGFDIRRTEEILRRIKALDESPINVPRPKEKRLIVNCRQFAVLTCSILRNKGIPARVRAGYSLYTWGGGKFENHWICEYYKSDEQRWILVDAQIDDKQKKLMKIDFNTFDMPQGKFLSAGEGWQLFRDGKADPNVFGLGGKDGWKALGWDMVMSNVTCDMMALNKMELLPWDVSPYWHKKKEQMSAADMVIIDEAALLCCQVNNRWARMRELYDSHLVLQMPKDFEKKE